MKHYMLKLSLFAIVVLMCAACQKNDANDSTLETKQQQAVERFLSLPGGAEPDLGLVVNELEAKNKRFGFITKFIAAYGYIKWEHVVKFEYNDGSRSYFLPLGNDTRNEVGAVIECVVKDGRTYATAYHRSDLDAAVKRTQGTTDKIAFIGLFREFEHTVYAKPRYWITFFDTKGNELYAYPADESKVPPQTKAGGCYWVGVGVEDIEGGGSSGGATDIRWELRCRPPDALPVFNDSRPEDDENTWDLPGDGGGGAPPDNTPPPPNQNPKDPCELLNEKMGRDINFIQGAKNIQHQNKNNAAKNKEYGFFGYKDGDTYRGGFTDGVLVDKQAEMAFPSFKVDIFMHTHPQGTNSMFSLTDLQTIYSLQQKNLINNTADFAFGVVTGDGTTYMLMIDDQSKWDAWSHRMFDNNIGDVLGDLFDFQKRKYNIVEGSNIATNEKAFLNFLQNASGGSGTGLKLYKGDAANFKTWQRQGLDGGSNPTNENCK